MSGAGWGWGGCYRCCAALQRRVLRWGLDKEEINLIVLIFLSISSAHTDILDFLFFPPKINWKQAFLQRWQGPASAVDPSSDKPSQNRSPS